MKNRKLGVVLLFVIIAIPVVSFAEDSLSDGDILMMRPTSTENKKNDEFRRELKQEKNKEIKNIKIETRNSVKETREEFKEKSKKEREGFRGEVRDIRATSTLSAEEKADKIEEEWRKKEIEIGKMKEERNKKFEEIRLNTKKTILERREVLKIDLRKISDQKKVQIVEKADEKLEKINVNRTNHFIDVLNHLERTLAKINVRISAAEAKAIDVSAAKKSAEDAGKSIASARIAVEAQAGKTYKMTITDENKLKIDVGNTVKKLQNDLKQVRIAVQTAHDAVRKAAVTLAKALGLEDKSKNGSSSSSTSSSISSSSSASSLSSSVASSVSSSVAISSSSSVSSSASSESSISSEATSSQSSS